jgi:hypothetical protein
MKSHLQESIKLANESNYLDQLAVVYPMIPETNRELSVGKWEKVEAAFESRDDVTLIKALLDLELFPIKDSFVPFFRRDKGALDRNPETVKRLAERLYEMGLNDIWDRATQPKETNRQIGPMFRRWIQAGSLGVPLIRSDSDFEASIVNCVYDQSDAALKVFAETKLGYDIDKGLDFIGKFGGRYVIGEAKFLTDFGGHQDRQLDDALKLANWEGEGVTTVAILDGVVYFPNGGSMYRKVTDAVNSNIVSSLLLRDFLESL